MCCAEIILHELHFYIKLSYRYYILDYKWSTCL